MSVRIIIELLCPSLLYFCLILHLNKSWANFSNCRSSSSLSAQVIFRSIKSMNLLLSCRESGSRLIAPMQARAARIISSINTSLLFKEVLLFRELIFFLPCLVVLDSFDLNVS
jgi:hypothetical protein